MAVINPMDPGPLGPGIVIRAFRRWLLQDLKLDQTSTSVSQRRGDAIGARVAATDYDYILTVCSDVIAILVIAVQKTPGIRVEKLHGEVNALQAASCN